ncbi:MAG: MATE family efflux transporter [Agathobacter sp.]|nr:MATE family efflux transporter [Agathobacter sp.]
MNTKTTDLTTGNPRTVLWRFCLPLFGSIIFQQLYNIADSLIAGKCIGENALAAVGNSYEITLIFIAFATGCNMACSVITSQLFGAKKYSMMKTAVYTAMISVAVLCGLLMIFGMVSSDWLLNLMNTPAEIYGDSKLYMDIYIWGLPFLFFYNLATGIFSAMGDSKTPFVFLAISSTANIVVNMFFVAVLDMGVAGVAWATFLCQGVSCVLAVVTIFRRLRLITTEIEEGNGGTGNARTSEATVKLFDLSLFRKFVSIAVPSILQQSSISIGNIIIQSAINDCGVAVTAGYAAGIKLQNLVITAFTTLGNGISNFAAQNIGAGKLERVRAGHKAGIQMVWTICVPVVLLYTFGARLLVSFFIDTPTLLALNSGAHFLYICAPFYFLISVKLATDGILRGAGMMKEFVIATTLDLILRVVLVKILVVPFGYLGIWAAWPIGWVLGTSLSLIYYRKKFITT